MSHQSKTTVDHDEIRQWAEARGGQPTTIEGTPKKGEAAGLLRIDFPTGTSNPPLEPVSWDEFFEKFDAENLAFVYQDQKESGEESYFCKFVDRKSADIR
jgi:hypothetical protein